MTFNSRIFTYAAMVLATASCGGAQAPSSDPRCDALCIVAEPYLSGAFDICSAASAQTCKQLCLNRLTGVGNLCGSCLLEKAAFGSTDEGPGNGICQSGSGGSGQCTITGRVGSCSYPPNDKTAEDNCIRQVYPRREIACTTDFRPVEQCAATCGSRDGG